MRNKDILEFAKIISGIFSNKEQALENPKKFAHIQIHIRPLFFKTFKCFAFYSEQRYQHDIWNPYRQSISKLSHQKDIFILNNHKIEGKERFTGGALDISLTSLCAVVTSIILLLLFCFFRTNKYLSGVKSSNLV